MGTPTVPMNDPGISGKDNQPGPVNPSSVIQLLQQVLSGQGTVPSSIPQTINRTAIPAPQITPKDRPAMNYGETGQEFRTVGGRQRAGLQQLFGNAGRMVESAAKNKEMKQMKSLSMDIERVMTAVAAIDADPNDQGAKDVLNQVLDPSNKNFKQLQEAFDVNFLQDTRKPGVQKAFQSAMDKVKNTITGKPPQSPAPNAQPAAPQGAPSPQVGAPPQAQTAQVGQAPQTGQPAQQPNMAGLNSMAQKLMRSFPQMTQINPNYAALQKMETDRLKAVSTMGAAAIRGEASKDVATTLTEGAFKRETLKQNNDNLRAQVDALVKMRGQDKQYAGVMARVKAELKKAEAISDITGSTKRVQMASAYIKALSVGVQGAQRAVDALIRQRADPSLDKAGRTKVDGELDKAKEALSTLQTAYKVYQGELGKVVSQGVNGGGKSGVNFGGVVSPPDLLKLYDGLVGLSDDDEEDGGPQ